MQKKIKRLIFLSAIVVPVLTASLFFCFKEVNPISSGAPAPSHEKWQQLLQIHVNDTGAVNYSGFLQDSSKLAEYIKQLGDNVPDRDSWSEKEQLAYYINLYNAATIQLVLRHYPLGSIKDIGTLIQLPRVNTPWQKEFIRLGNKFYDLDDIEHNIIREKFSEPRIHFALVCAAISCPKLRNEAYTAQKLEKQLQDQTESFLANPFKNVVSNSSWSLSKIFKWYGGDFDSVGGYRTFISKTTGKKVPSEITWKDYFWALNDQK